MLHFVKITTKCVQISNNVFLNFCMKRLSFMCSKTFLQEILCKLMGSSQSSFVFFSSFSVVLIAVDRLIFIVYPGSFQISINKVSVSKGKSNIDSLFIRLLSYLVPASLHLPLFHPHFSSSQNWKLCFGMPHIVMR